MEIFATTFIENIKTGISKPVKIRANDNKQYVVKFASDNFSKNKVLINDFICSKLAAKVSINVPKVELIFFPKLLIDIEDELKKRSIREGYHFGSLFWENTTGFIGENQLATVTNIEDVNRIIAFDLWVGNDDRAHNPGNLLFTTSGNPQIVTIDYGNAFNGPEWEEFDLTDDIIIPAFDGEVYSCLRNYVSGYNPFDEICNKIENIEYSDILECIDQVPEEWNFTRIDRRLIRDFLYKRRSVIRNELDLLQKQYNYFPNWRR